MTTDEPVASPAEVAAEAGLRYVDDEGPGITRRRHGRGWSYRRPDGLLVAGEERARVEATVIPPAWTDVWISPDPHGHILATGRDADGRKQYRYHPQWTETRDRDKFDRMADFGRGLPDLRAQVDADLRERGLPERKVLALVVRLLDTTLIRVGNDSYATEHDVFGLTTLRGHHVNVDDESVTFEFVAKGGLDRTVLLDDAGLARVVKACHELGGQELFAYEADAGRVIDVGSDDVNRYLRQLVGAEVSSKDFRTWGGTATAAAALTLGRPPESPREAERCVLAAYDVAAEVLGNTRAVCRSSYVHPAVPEAYRRGELHDHWKRARSTARMERSERLVLRVLEG